MSSHYIAVPFLIAVFLVWFLLRRTPPGQDRYLLVRGLFDLIFPNFIYRLIKFETLYPKEGDIQKIAAKQLVAQLWQAVARAAGIIITLFAAFQVYIMLSKVFDYRVWLGLLTVYNWCMSNKWLPIGAAVVYVFRRVNLWSRINLLHFKSEQILSWGELYRKGVLKDALKVKLVEKYWYICLLRKAMAHTASKDFGFTLVGDQTTGILVDACKLPGVYNTGGGWLKIDLRGFPISPATFVKYAAEKLESFTGLRTTAISKSGESAVVNWQVSHKDLPKGIIRWQDAPKPPNRNVQYIGHNGQDWFGIDWNQVKHLALVGNTNSGKGIIIETIIAGAAPESIFLVGDLGIKDGADFARLQYDTNQLEALDKIYYSGKINVDQYHDRCEGLLLLPTVIVSKTKSAYLQMCRWAFKQYLDRKDMINKNKVKNVASLSALFKEKFGKDFHLPRIFLILDEAAAAMIGSSDKDKETKEIQYIINRLVLAGRAYDIMIIQATQRASLDALGEARDQFFAITLHTSKRNLKMIYEEDAIEIPAPGASGEYKGMAVMRTPDGGFSTFKVLMVTDDDGKESEKILPRIVYDRVNLPVAQVSESLKYTLALWEKAVDFMSDTEEFVPVDTSVKIDYGTHKEFVNA